LPPSAWRTVNLEISSRKHRTPRVYEHKARPHERTFRQFFITDLGHDEPTILLTNDARSTAKTIITRYAKRMLIENALTRNSLARTLPTTRPQSSKVSCAAGPARPGGELRRNSLARTVPQAPR
jgi:hypothetical protein